MIPQHSLPGGRYPLPGPDFHRLDRASFAWRTQTEFSMIQRMAQNERRAAAVFGAKTEIISDLPPTAIYTLATPSTSTRFRNLDQPVALARGACEPKPIFYK